MGYLMARNLAKGKSDGPPLLVWNRTPSKSEELQKELGTLVRIANDLTDLVEQCDIIFTSLNEDSVVKSVYEQFAETLKVRCCRCRRFVVLTSADLEQASLELEDLRRDQHGASSLARCPSRCTDVCAADLPLPGDPARQPHHHPPPLSPRHLARVRPSCYR